MAAPTANQSLGEWLSDILAAISAGGASTGVQGVVADGAAAGTTKPVIAGVVDGSGNAQWLLGDTSGRVVVNVATGATPSDTATNAEFQGGTNGTGSGMRGQAVALQAWDGSTNWKRCLTRAGAAGTAAAGLLGVAPLFWDGSAVQNWLPATGSQANAWSAAATGAGGTSTALDCQLGGQVSFFGNSSGATTFTIQFSQDNTNFYDSETTLVLGGSGNFGKSFICGARYVRVKSSANVTVTATLAAKQ